MTTLHQNHSAVLTITPPAAARIATMLAQQTPVAEAVFLSLKTKGCSGMSYDLQFLPKLADAPKFSEQVTAHGVTVVIDSAAMLHLIGSTMDYKEGALHSGFDFINPHETGRCGCGESFSVNPQK